MHAIRTFISILFFFGLPAGCTLNAQIVNGYASVESIIDRELTIGVQNESHGSFSVGQQVLLMQMQDDVLGNTTNSAAFGSIAGIETAGQYEIHEIEFVERSAELITGITLSTAPATTFNTGDHARLQVVTFPQLGTPNFNTTSDITALPWNGDYGGIVAFQVEQTLTLEHAVHADGMGFRGGARSNNHGPPLDCDNSVYRSNSANNGEKGEGIYRNTNNDWRYARGPLVSGGGGGGGHNGGGGGGSNFTAGGIGGAGYDGSTTGCEVSISGLGGVALDGYIEANRIFMGGGGGGGQQNNSASTNGARGGGIVFLKAHTITTPESSCEARISANGEHAALAGNDGAGGGGAGGGIVLQVNHFEVHADCPLTVEANGGNGGSVNSMTHAAGGGGGQGAIFYAGLQPTTNITTSTLNGAGGCDNTECNQGGQPGAGADNMGIFSGMPSLLNATSIILSAKPKGNAVLLDWQFEAISFEVELQQKLQRSSDLTHWKTICEYAHMPSVDTGAQHTDYPKPGTWYYRVHAPEAQLISNIVGAKIKPTSISMRLFPNPAQHAVTIAFEEVTSGHIQVISQEGRVVMEQGCHATHEIQLPVHELSSGAYTVTFSSANHTERRKLIVH